MINSEQWQTRLAKVAGAHANSKPVSSEQSKGALARYVAIAFIVLSSIAWTVVTIDFIRNAPESAKRACAGKNIWSGGPDAYYWCLQQVTAGGKVRP